MRLRTVLAACIVLVLLAGCGVTRNMSRGTPRPLADGTVLLLRQGNAYGALVLDRQRERPEQVSFTWLYREDGGSVLDANDPNVHSGQDTSNQASIPEMRFGPFVVPWSVAADGSGYIYYSRLAHDPAQAGELEIAITSLASPDGVDAAEQRWLYRAAPPGYYSLGGRWYWD